MRLADTEAAIEVHPRLALFREETAEKSPEKVPEKAPTLLRESLDPGDRLGLAGDRRIDAETAEILILEARRRNQVKGFDGGEDGSRKM
jgi:hypothetical protein